MKLTNDELSKINGGAIKFAVSKWALAGGFAAFLIGAINGYLRPLTCKTEK